jgi:undecaprenyl-diphosphatase
MFLKTAIAESLYRLAKSSPVFSKLAVFAATKTIWILVAAVIVWEVVAKFSSRSFLVIIVSVFFAWGLQLAVAYLVNRERPFRHNHESALMKLRFNTPSFPSGHTTVSCAMAAAVFAQDPLWGSILFLFAATIALGRMAVGVHYISDVLGGAVLGIGVASLAAQFIL